MHLMRAVCQRAVRVDSDGRTRNLLPVSAVVEIVKVFSESVTIAFCVRIIIVRFPRSRVIMRQERLVQIEADIISAVKVLVAFPKNMCDLQSHDRIFRGNIRILRHEVSRPNVQFPRKIAEERKGFFRRIDQFIIRIPHVDTVRGKGPRRFDASFPVKGGRLIFVRIALHLFRAVRHDVFFRFRRQFFSFFIARRIDSAVLFHSIPPFRSFERIATSL